MFTFDEDLPTVIMEDDNETELGIVQPILNDILTEIVNRNCLKNLQDFVDLTLEQVAEETHEKFFENLIETCVKNAVDLSENSKEG